MGSSKVQGELWSRNAREWAQRQEKMHLPLYRGALQALGALQGKRLLDAGSGSGMFLELAAAAGAVVSGVDAAQGLLEVARERVPSAQLRLGDLEELPFESGAFEIVTAFNSIQYAADPRRALSELARVCTRDGSILVGQWADPGRCQSEGLFVKLRKLAPPPPGAPAPLALSGAGHLEARMVESGLRPVAWGEAAAPFVYGSLDEAWRAQASAGPVVRVQQAIGEERTRDAVVEAFRDGLQPDGSVRHENVFRWVIAKPA